MENLKTTIRAYHFDIRKESDKAAYAALVAKLEGQGLKCFETWGGGSHYLPDLDGLEIWLEADHLFNNQWNTAPIDGRSEKGLRVFDWAQDYPINISKSIKRGHYLEQTEAMRQARARRVKCGYCGKQYAHDCGKVFCDNCLDSEYLEAENLKLLRLRSVADDSGEYPELSKTEKAKLLPIYKAAQIHGSTERGKARIAEKRERIKAEYDKAIRVAEAEYKGLTWLMDKGINTENVIFYDHKESFCFGWRGDHGIAVELLEGLVSELKGFPYPCTIKTDKRGELGLVQLLQELEAGNLRNPE